MIILVSVQVPMPFTLHVPLPFDSNTSPSLGFFAPHPLQILPSKLWLSLTGVAVCATSTSPQTEQCLPSVRPVSVQVGAFAGVITGVCTCAVVVTGAVVVAAVVVFPGIRSERPPGSSHAPSTRTSAKSAIRSKRIRVADFIVFLL